MTLATGGALDRVTPESVLRARALFSVVLLRNVRCVRWWEACDVFEVEACEVTLEASDVVWEVCGLCTEGSRRPALIAEPAVCAAASARCSTWRRGDVIIDAVRRDDAIIDVVRRGSWRWWWDWAWCGLGRERWGCCWCASGWTWLGGDQPLLVAVAVVVLCWGCIVWTRCRLIVRGFAMPAPPFTPSPSAKDARSTSTDKFRERRRVRPVNGPLTLLLRQLA